MWQVNLIKIRLKRSCISPWSSMTFGIVSANSLHWIIIYDLVSVSCHHHHCPYINLWLGCAIPVQLIMNPHNQYLPIPSLFGSHSVGLSASPSTRNSPTKRSRTEALQESSCETPPWSKYSVSTELKLNVKGLYKGEKERCLPSAGTMTWQIKRDGQRWPNNNTDNKARWPDNDSDGNDWLTNWLRGLLDDDGNNDPPHDRWKVQHVRAVNQLIYKRGNKRVSTVLMSGVCY